MKYKFHIIYCLVVLRGGAWIVLLKPHSYPKILTA